MLIKKQIDPFKRHLSQQGMVDKTRQYFIGK